VPAFIQCAQVALRPYRATSDNTFETACLISLLWVYCAVLVAGLNTGSTAAVVMDVLAQLMRVATVGVGVARGVVFALRKRQTHVLDLLDETELPTLRDPLL
jgi:hypothetical protein